MAKARYRVQWALTALSDFVEAAAFIRREQPAAAKRLYSQIYRQTQLLRTHPMLGRAVPEFRNRLLRELIVRPYRAIYRVLPQESRIEVLAVVHSSRLLPSS